jgi:hypothetical protein
VTALRDTAAPQVPADASVDVTGARNTINLRRVTCCSIIDSTTQHEGGMYAE